MSRALAQPLRGTLQSGSVLLGLCLLAAPPVAVLSSGTATANALWTTLRIAGLEAFTVLFINVAVGAFRPFFNRVVPPVLAHRTHVFVGVLGFALALSHGVCVLTFGISGYPPGGVWIGPAVLVVLAAVITTALLRTRFRSSWRHLHRLNYALFMVALLHGLVLGTDLRANRLLLGCSVLYAVVVVGGFFYRLYRTPRAGRAGPQNQP